MADIPKIYIPPAMDQRVLSGKLKEEHKMNHDQDNFGNTIKGKKESELSHKSVGTTNKLNMINSLSESIPDHHSHPVVKLEPLDLDCWRNAFLNGKGTKRDSSFDQDHTATYERTEFRLSDFGQRDHDKKPLLLKIDMDLEEQDEGISCYECAKLTNMKTEKKKCGKCSQCFLNNTDIQVETMHKKEYTCDVCGGCFSQFDQLKTHLKKHTDDKKAHPSRMVSVGEKYTLQENTRDEIASKTSLHDHMKVKNQLFLKKCQFCDEEFQSENVLKKHTNSFHVIHSCDICRQSIPGKLMLEYHKLAHEHESRSGEFICDLCGEIYKTVVSFQTHLEIHKDKDRPYRCEICGRGYVGYRMLKRHIRESLHTDQATQKKSNLFEKCTTTRTQNQKSKKLFKCGTCGRDFLNQRNLDKHRETHFTASLVLDRGNSDLSCDKCEKTFKTKSTLKNHIDNEHVTKHCHICGEEFLKGKMKYHMTTHREKQRCNVCGKDYSGIVGINRHMQCRTGITKEKEKNFSCGICGKKFVLKKSLNLHKKVHQSTSSLEKHLTGANYNQPLSEKCQFCDDEFRSKNKLLKHTNSFHVLHLCDICGQSIPGKLMLDYHKLAHEHESKSREFLCDLCGEIYKTVVSFQTHLEIHKDKDRPYRCDICGRGYVGYRMLKRHIREGLHTDQAMKEKFRFSCKLCNRKYDDSNLFEKHMNSHTKSQKNKKLFKCGTCDRDFLTQGNLDKHRETHFTASLILSCSDTSDLSCDKCGKTFKTKSTLKNHIDNEHVTKHCHICGEEFLKGKMKHHMTTHLEKQRCDVCGKDYNGIQGITRHMQCRAGLANKKEKKFSCEICGKKYMSKRSLYSHREFHKQKNPLKLHKVRKIRKQANLMKKCQFCDIKVMSENVLQKHVDSFHVVYPCDICEQFVSGALMLDYHKLAHEHENKSCDFCCDLCGEIYKTVDSFRTHLKIHKDEDKPYVCEICGKAYNGFRKLKRHIRETFHMDENMQVTSKFSCDVCGKIFTENSLLEKHLKCHRNKNLLHCGTCGKDFVHQSALDRHCETHLGTPSPLKCEKCDRTFKTKYYLDNHVDNEHVLKPCYICSKEFPKGKLKYHIATHQEKQKCEVCGKICFGLKGIKQHMKLHNAMNGEKKFSCQICGKKFLVQSYLKRHMDMHKTTLQCEICGRGFSVQQHLQRHLTRVHFKLMATCQICNDTFKSEHLLQKHMNSVHTIHSCDTCKHSFTGKRMLDYHTLAHEHENKSHDFCCDTCGGFYKTVDGFRSHLEIHKNNDRPYMCEICGKSYAKFLFLKRHMQRVKYHVIENKHGDSNLFCNICGKGFNKEDKLGKHMDFHKKKIKFKCQACGKGFMNSGALYNHCRTAHRTKAVTIKECDKTLLTELTPESHEQVTKSSDVFDKEMSNSYMKYPTVTQQARQKCDICGQYFSGTKELKRHIESQHRSVKMDIHEGTTECNVCGRSFPSKISLQIHMRRHSAPASTEKCHLCDSAFKSGYLLHKHINFFHTMHSCEICGQSIQGKRLLDYHKLAHEHESKSRDFHCDACGEIYKTVDSFRTHLEIHKDEDRPYMCEICGKTYVAFPMLMRHFQLKDFHLDRKKTFSCDICGNDYAENRLLERHKKYHERKILFQCEICGKGFTGQYTLDLHFKTHETIESSCDKCNKTFKSKSSLENHIDNEHITKLCDICGEEFLKGKMKHHMTAHQEKQRCGVCGKYYSRIGLELHMKFHKKVIKKITKIKKFSCEICDNKFTSEISLNNHKEIHEKSSKCNFCGQYFSRRYLQRHMRIHSRLSSVKCRLCEETFKTESGLQKHMESFHDVHLCDICGESVLEKRLLAYHKVAHEYETQSRDFFCDTCGAIYKTVHNFRTHLAIHKDENKPYMCEICGRAYTGFQMLQRHLQEKNFHKDINAQEDSTFTCYKCGKSYHESDTLEKHVLDDHKMTNPFRCTKCGKGFSQQTSLDRHLKIHIIVKCEECGKTYNTEYALKKHVVSAHVKEPCDICGKSVIKGKLKHHKNTHQEKHQCDICGKYYYGVERIKLHIESHTKEVQNFTCGVCGKTYMSEESFRTHTRYHQRRTRCSICGRCFPWKFMFWKHMAMHNRQKSVGKCEYCDKTFKTKGVLQNHIQTFHNPDNCA